MPLFDPALRRLRRDRAYRTGAELFLHDRVFDDLVERLAVVARRFERALLLGCPNPDWPGRLRERVAAVEVADPGPAFATAAGGTVIDEESWNPEPGRYDLILAVGTLDSVSDLPGALLRLRFALAADGLLLGAMAGGETLPALRGAMRAADALAGAAAPHVHPRIEAAGLAQLLTAAGFAMPVVDIDRIAVAYRDLGQLVRELRRMGATNLLLQRPRTPLSRAACRAAADHFAAASVDGRTTERFEVVNFSAWNPV